MSLLFIKWAILIGIGCCCVLMYKIPLSHVVLPIVAIMILDWYSSQQEQQSEATVDQPTTTSVQDTTTTNIDNTTTESTTNIGTDVQTTTTTTNTEPLSGVVVEQQKTTETVNNEVVAAVVEPLSSSSTTTTIQQLTTTTTTTNSSDIQQGCSSSSTSTDTNTTATSETTTSTTVVVVGSDLVEPVTCTPLINSTSNEPVILNTTITTQETDVLNNGNVAIVKMDDALKLLELNEKFKDLNFHTQKEFAIEEIECNPLVYYLLSEELRRDEEIAILAVEKNVLNFLFCRVEHPKLITNWKLFQIVIQHIKNDDKKFHILKRFNCNSFSKNILENNEIIPFIMSFWNSQIHHVLSLQIYSIKEFVLECVKRDGLALQFASDLLKDDEQLVSIAINQNALALQFASNRLKDDEQLVRIAVEQNGSALKVASDRLKDDEQLVMTAVKENGLALQFASDRLKNDREVVKTALLSKSARFSDCREEIYKLAGTTYQGKWGRWGLQYSRNE